ncbi:Hypothetical predicted protein [Prunus dulcis]|uniref:Uncharacterized protein n=1 Tax=Prunus dulcis TaxID=3755 RepID=A0A5E4FDT4_PRUDU|nr:Hypothetical predicted protein [Prunus dulcis]
MVRQGGDCCILAHHRCEMRMRKQKDARMEQQGRRRSRNKATTQQATSSFGHVIGWFWPMLELASLSPMTGRSFLETSRLVNSVERMFDVLACFDRVLL